jgi:hypothetical protein
VFESFRCCYLPSATGAKGACPKFITGSRELIVACRASRQKYKPAGDFFICWRYPVHARLKSPG